MLWFLVGIIFLQDRIMLLESPTIINTSRLFIYVLLISELIRWNRFKRNFILFPLKVPILIFIVGLFLVAFFDSRHFFLLNTYRVYDDFLQTVFLLFLGYSVLEDFQGWKKIQNGLIAISLFLCAYGLYNFFSQTNPIDDLITKVYNRDSYFDIYLLTDSRFRVNSFVSHPIYFGYLVGLLLVCCVHTLYYIKPYNWFYISVAVLLLFNVILSNSRIALISTIIGIFILISLTWNILDKIRTVLILLPILFILYNVPFLQNSINQTIDVFSTGGVNTDGSSLEMRKTQFWASYQQFLKRPLTGNGFLYINENLGGASQIEDFTSADEFAGFESYIYHIIIEQGIVGVIINSIYFVVLFGYFFRAFTSCKFMAGLALSILSMFLIFIIGTGSLGSWPVTMLLLGSIIKFIDLKKGVFYRCF